MGCRRHGMGLSYPALTLTVLAEARAGREGTATASLQVSELLGIALGTGITGELVASAGDAGGAAREGLLGAFTTAATRARRRRSPSPPDVDHPAWRPPAGEAARPQA